MFASHAYRVHFGREGADERAAEAERMFGDVRELVAWAEGLEPGPELVQVLHELNDIPMDHDLHIGVAALWTKARSWTEAQEMAATAAAAGAVDDESDAWIAADLAATAHISERAVAERMALMRRVSAALPLCWEALNAGQITMSHLRAVDAVTEQVAAELAQQVEADVLPKALAREWTPSQLRAAARKAMYKLDAQGARARATRAKVRRTDVKLYSDEDDMSSLVATGDAWTNRQVMDEINRRADALKRAGDSRSLGELRMASLAAALLDVRSVRSLNGHDESAAGTSAPPASPCACGGGKSSARTPSFRATARSPPPWRGASLPTPHYDSWSSRPSTASRLVKAATATTWMPSHDAGSTRATASACSPVADGRRSTAMQTTPTSGTKAARPTVTTAACSAAAITTSRPPKPGISRGTPMTP